MKNIIFHTILLLCVCLKVSGQVNLVPNPSFEDTLQCPFLAGQIYFSPPWQDPTNSSSDLLNACNNSSTSWVGIPQNLEGYQTARTGLGYAGFLTYSQGSNIREYIQVKLSSKLQFAYTYAVEMFVSMADTQTVACNNMGIYFSDTAITGSGGYIFPFIPQINNDQIANPLTSKINWTKISGTLVANGTENYITIGNFLNDLSSDTVYVGGGGAGLDASYYYIDDVSVICTDCPIVIASEELMIPTLLAGGDVFKIKGLSANSTLYLFNGLGQTVYYNSSYDNSFNVINLSSGIYYYYLKFSNGDLYKGKLCIIK